MPAPIIKTFKYTGTGAPFVYRLGFQPDIIIIKGDSTLHSVIKTKWSWRAQTNYFGNPSGHQTNCIQSVMDAEFFVGTDTLVNTAGVTYYGVAIADNGSGLIACRSYCGDAVDGREIESVGFRPVFVMVMRDNTVARYWRTTDSVCLPMGAVAQLQAIESLTDNGFTVSSDADLNEKVSGSGTGAEGLDYIAFAESPYWAAFNYTGTGADNRAVTLGFQPAFVLAKSNDTGTPQTARMAIDTMDSGDSSSVLNTAPTTGLIKSLTSTGFTVGTDASINGNGIRFDGFAIKSNTSPIPGRAAPLSPRRKAVEILTASGGILCESSGTDLHFTNGDPFTIEWIARLADNVSAPRVLASLSQNATNMPYRWQQQTTHGTLAWLNNETAASYTTNSGLRLPRGRLVHFGWTFDGTNRMRVYCGDEWIKDLNAADGITIAAPADPANTHFVIGAQRATSTTVAGGAVGAQFALVRLYDRVLTLNEWRQRHRVGFLGRPGADVTDFIEEWDAENASGSTWTATNSSANNGTIYNAAVIDA